MCGIAGYVCHDGLPDAYRRLGRRMVSTLRHRGPDDLDDVHDRYATLGHARLSIVDLDAGRQPLTNETGSLHLIANGEIYNYRTLREDLIARGHRFRTNSDCEVILHLYEEHGMDFVGYLNGMFAIALWDAAQRKLILVRDRLGIKPLYYSARGREIRFGSELKAILADPRVSAEIDAEAIVDYLTFGHVPAPRSIYRQIRKLEPGHMLIATEAGAALHRYWEMPTDRDGVEEDWDQDATRLHRMSEAFEALLEDAVRLRLMADVPLGAFLSGGVDSTAVVAAMTRAHAGSVLTHTVGFNDAGFDERDPARTVARLLGTDHRELSVTPDAVGTAQLLAKHFDEPFADSSAIPTYYLSKAARERVTVALAGDGGDEMLAGYRRYRFDMAEHQMRTLAPSWLRRSTCGVAGWLYPKADWLPRPLRAKRTLQNIACDDVTGHMRSVAIQAGTLPDQWLHSDRREGLREYDPFLHARTLFARYPSQHLLNRLLYLDMKTLMVDDILTKVDRMSMAVGLEVRVPLLDHRIVELASRMPPTLKLDGSVGKVVLRKALGRRLNDEIARRPKRGFDVPMDPWFRGPLREMANDLLGCRSSWHREWIRPEVAESLLNAHQKGTGQHGHELWTLLSLELWARTVKDRATDASQPVSSTDRITTPAEQSADRHEPVTAGR